MPYPTTPNLGLPLVPDGDQAWGQAMRDAMAAIDGALGGGGTAITHLAPTITLSASTGTIDLGNVFTIEKATCTDSGRFRLYRDTTTRNADMSRIVLTEPTPGNGLLLEVVFAVGVMTIPLAPLAPGAPMVAGEPCAWYWEGATTSGTLTLTITQMEA